MTNETKSIMEHWIKTLKTVNDKSVIKVVEEMEQVVNTSKFDNLEDLLAGCERDIYFEMKNKENGQDK
jgi:hypothetical protein